MSAAGQTIAHPGGLIARLGAFELAYVASAPWLKRWQVCDRAGLIRCFPTRREAEDVIRKWNKARGGR